MGPLRAAAISATGLRAPVGLSSQLCNKSRRFGAAGRRWRILTPDGLRSPGKTQQNPPSAVRTCPHKHGHPAYVARDPVARGDLSRCTGWAWSERGARLGRGTPVGADNHAPAAHCRRCRGDRSSGAWPTAASIPDSGGVYLVGHPIPVPGAAELAAVLACGERAFVSHRSAAVLWGLVRDLRRRGGRDSRPSPVTIAAGPTRSSGRRAVRGGQRRAWRHPHHSASPHRHRLHLHRRRRGGRTGHRRGVRAQASDRAADPGGDRACAETRRRGVAAGGSRPARRPAADPIRWRAGDAPADPRRRAADAAHQLAHRRLHRRLRAGRTSG